MTLQRHLGSNGPAVLPLGLGTFGFSHAYGHADAEEALATLYRALDLGCALLDTADSYGAGENESWLGRALQGRLHSAFLSTKIGLVCDASGAVTGRNGRPAHIHQAIDASLRRLRIEALDLCTLHRIDPEVPVEETVGAMAAAVALGKVRLLGLSEASPEQLLRAHAVHPIAALQSEYSLWTRGPEAEMIPLCHRLGVAFVAFSPLGRGMFAAKPESLVLTTGDFRSSLPRFQGGNLESNFQLVRELGRLAASKGCSPSQVALAWVLRGGDHVFAIPGTRTRKHLEENIAALDVALTPDEMEDLDRIFAPESIAGERYAKTSIFRPDGA